MSENKFQHEGIYTLHALQNQQRQNNDSTSQHAYQHQRKSSINSSVTGQHNQSIQSQINQSSIGINRIQKSNQKKENQQNHKHLSTQSYADFIAGQANEYRQHKNSRFEQKMQPQQPQNSQRSPKGSNLSVWATDKENRFEWLGKDQKKYFKEINGQLKSYNEQIQVNQSTQGSWQKLIDKTLIEEQYQKKRSLSREAISKKSTQRVLYPDQQETPRFNPCFKGVIIQEQINPQKLEERARESKISKNHQKNLLSYEKIVNKGVVPDTTGREIAVSRRKSTDIKMKYDYQTRVVLKTEEGIPTKYSPSKIRQMYEEAYNNNMNSVIFQTEISQNNDSFALPQKISQSKIFQTVSTLNDQATPNEASNTLINNFLENKSTIVNQAFNNSQKISKPPLTQSTVIDKNNNKSVGQQQTQSKKIQQNSKDIQSNNDFPINKQSNQTQNTQINNFNDTRRNSQSIYLNDSRKNSIDQVQRNESQTQKKKENLSNTLKIQVDTQNSPFSKSPEQIKKNFYNVDYQFNQQKQRSNSKRRSSQFDVLRSGDRLWTDVRDQNYEQLNRDPSRERLKTNASDRQNFQGNQEFWQSQKQDLLWKQEMKLKEIQNNNVVVDNRKKVNRRTQSLSTNLMTENSVNLNDMSQNFADNNISYVEKNNTQQSQIQKRNYSISKAQQESSMPFQIQPQQDKKNSISNNNSSYYQQNKVNPIQNSLRDSPVNINRQINNANSYGNQVVGFQQQNQVQENAKVYTPRQQYDQSPYQRVKTQSTDFSNKQKERDPTLNQFYNIQQEQVRAIKQKMQKSQIQF